MLSRQYIYINLLSLLLSLLFFALINGVRVSTDIQAEDGFSIAAQQKLLKDYCVKNDIVIYKIFADEGISGQKENRPAFQEMIADAENKLFDIVLVHKYDRFARKYELSSKIENRLNNAGVMLIAKA